MGPYKKLGNVSFALVVIIETGIQEISTTVPDDGQLIMREIIIIKGFEKVRQKYCFSSLKNELEINGM